MVSVIKCYESIESVLWGNLTLVGIVLEKLVCRNNA